MTDDDRLPDPAAAVRLLPRGAMVVVRSRDAARRGRLASAILSLARARGLTVLIANDPALVSRLGADGLHLSEANARQAARWRAVRGRWFISAAAHSERSAVMLNYVDAIFFSPVFETKSHPGKKPITAVRANRIAREMSRPMYALGGIGERNAVLLHGFAGIAAIAALAS